MHAHTRTHTHTHTHAVLGTERRNSLYAGVYLMRSDVVEGVRLMAWRVWKSIVKHR